MAEKLFEEAKNLESTNANKSISIYNQIISIPDTNLEEINKFKELTIYRLGKSHASLGNAKELTKLLTDIRPFFDKISKAKTAKIVRSLIDFISEIPNTINLQIELCKESIAWTKDTKRVFLRQRIESKLAALLLDAKEYIQALALTTELLKEVKRLDDKPLVVEIQLVESRIHHALRDISKAKASLTAARTNANAIYCLPLMQAQLDMQSGVLHAEEKDYKTAFSYFFEAFEGLSTLEEHHNALRALKYMLLCKIMLHTPDDVASLVTGKVAINYSGLDIDAMKAVAKAFKERSLSSFEDAKRKYREQLTADPIIERHFGALYSTLLEQNLSRIIEPYSIIDLDRVSKSIQLPKIDVERKLSQMILDKKNKWNFGSRSWKFNHI